MTRRWAELAKGMEEAGRTRKQIAAIFGVSTACLCLAFKRIQPVEVPDWVPEPLRVDFERVARERGIAPATAWAQAEARR